MAVYLDLFINELLHLDDVRANRLVNAGAEGENIKSYRLFAEEGSSCAEMLAAIKNGTGKIGNRTVLKDSALVRTSADSPAKKWLWRDLSGESDARALDKFISDAYDVINLKGNNPLFLGLGALNWETVVSGEIRKIVSPLLIFPVKLIRGTATSPVEIEFVDDEAYFNPCLAEKVKRELPEFVYSQFPKIGGADLDEPLDLEKLDLNYFESVCAHTEKCGGNSQFSFDKNAVIIAQYNHGDICMYYDVKRNRENIEKHPLIRRIFGEQLPLPPVDGEAGEPRFILQKDSVQEDITRRILRGESLIVKGPPGTGKTLTIANVIGALLARGKRVLFASKKLSALSEVHAKLPENLRKFVMLLDCETEQRAASLNPSEIKREFKKLLKERSEYHFAPSVANGFERAVKAQAEAVLDIDGYFKQVFQSGYYDAVDTYFKSDLPAVDFALPEDAAKIGASGYGELLTKVETAAKYYEIMAKSEDSVYNCPWFGAENLKDAEGAFALNSSIRAGVNGLLDELSQISQVDAGEITLGDLYLLSGENEFNREEMLAALNALKDEDYKKLDKLVKDCVEAEKQAVAGFAFSEDGGYAFEELEKCNADLELTDKQINLLAENGGFLVDADISGVYPKLKEAVDKISALERERVESELDCLNVLDKLKPENYGEAVKSYQSFSKYGGGKPIGFFDLKTKKLYKSACGYSSRNNPSFNDIAGAISRLNEYFNCGGEIAALENLICKLFARKLDKRELECVYLIAKKCNAENYQSYVNCAVAAANALNICRNYCTCPKEFTLGELIATRRAYVLKKRLEKRVAELCKGCGVGERDTLSTAKSIVAVLRAGALKVFGGRAECVVDFLDGVRAAGTEFAQKISKIAVGLFNFGKKYFSTLYTVNPWELTAAQLKTFAATADDRAVLNAAISYHEIVCGGNALNLKPFFASVESGEINVSANRIAELFEHSFYKLTLEYALNKMGKRRNGLGKNVELAYETFEKAESEILKYNADIIENLCMSRIDPNDGDFAFVNADRGAKKSLRYLFKTHADAIIKLKRCFITSPSTASVLMRPEEYSSFDIVIVDEASQLEPVNLLPVLVRSKQCVLVGDEYQMPPLTHFKVKNKRRIDDVDSELSIDTDISALSLALHNRAFASCELACHYRSKTESLIAFSQREFYPYMRTFPAAVPFGDGLGFEDVYTPEGCCDGGVNVVEAKKVIEKLCAHFDKHYDETTGKLKKAVGVVAFGEAQLNEIKAQIPAELDKKIQRAFENYDDLPEKLIFFRTIESVQGQETDHLILSLTYGRDKSGDVRLTFGELNRDALGKNIFNVAVTRAQSEITVIHSLTATQISQNPRIAFIGDYLSLVEKFAAGGKTQFVSTLPESGANFISNVADFIVSCGVDRSRVIINYGVTDGSVRIPIAVLSKDLSHALAGIWCEIPVLKKYDYIDYNIKYVRSLCGRGWKLHRVFIHEWLDNSKPEKEALKRFVEKIKNV